MIDLSLLREDPKNIKSLVLKKDPNFDFDQLVRLDQDARALRGSVEQLRNEKNSLAKQAGKGITDELRNKSIEIGKNLKKEEESLRRLEVELKKLWLSCPNILMNDVPEGKKESNQVIKVFDEKREYDFPIKNHLELGESLGWFDFESAASMSGSQFALYKGEAVRLMYALINFMLRINTKHGFQLISPPELVTEQSLINSGNLPKFAEDVYKLPEDDLYLIPTAEVSLTNLYAGKILSKEDLPLNLCAWTSCFRREAGGYGSQERGLIRIHQFEKVELYTLSEPQNSEEEQKKMLACAEEILQELGLHYRVSLLAAQDCSFPSAKTYDVEVWIPSQERYYEVSSVSNCTDFQARRASIRYREESNSKPRLVHTLNASSLALPRLMVAIMENYQTKDGKIEFSSSIQEILNKTW
ncbi:serine--tRNA ligase [Candidatus Babeliales bacterium]|nr:serine--tRNA ligase [Candidatus Babeliales bacterium]